MKRIIGMEAVTKTSETKSVETHPPVYLDNKGELCFNKSGDCCCNLELDFHSDLFTTPMNVSGLLKELETRNEVYLKCITKDPASLVFRSDIGRAVTKLDVNFGSVNNIIKTILNGFMVNNSLGITRAYSNIVLPKCMDAVSKYSSDIKDAMKLLVASVARDVCAYDDTLVLHAYLGLSVCPLSILFSPFGNIYEKSIFIKNDCSSQPSIHAPVKYYHVIFDFKSCEIKEYLSAVDFAGDKDGMKPKSKVTATFDVDRFDISKMMNTVREIDSIINRNKE